MARKLFLLAHIFVIGCSTTNSDSISADKFNQTYKLNEPHAVIDKLSYAQKKVSECSFGNNNSCSEASIAIENIKVALKPQLNNENYIYISEQGTYAQRVIYDCSQNKNSCTDASVILDKLRFLLINTTNQNQQQGR